LLISCYELGHQPLGIALPLGFLERAGYYPTGMDISIEALDQEKIARARFVGISVPMHTALRLGVLAARRVRTLNPTCHLCFYGLYAWLNADYLLETVADSVIGGEYEASLVALVQALEDGKSGAVAGVRVRGRDARLPLTRLSFPIPSRRALPSLEKYARVEHDGRRGLVGYVEASRGCLHHCRHCPIPPIYGDRFFVVPKDVVLEDLWQLVAAGAQHITFGDADFLNGPGHSLGIVRALHAEFPEVTFDFTAKVEHVLKHRALFPELGALGCLFMVSAVESLSDTVLAYLDKGHTRADVKTALAITRNADIALRPSLVPFTPWATAADYLELFDFIEMEGLIDHVDPVQYTIRLLVPPGSLLLSQSAMQPFLGLLDQESFSYRWTHPDPRMDVLQHAASALVEQATKANEDPFITFYRLWDLARATLGAEPRIARSPMPSLERRPAPRLTEPWFC
jgi:radical SAM superfamily enzyme YgiQ (UPF0313 family)